jgi:hypothetical protein
MARKKQNLLIKKSGTWSDIPAPIDGGKIYTKKGRNWHSIKTVFVKNSSTWKKIWPITIMPFKMTVRINIASDTITLPFINGYNYNCEIDWGDNTPLTQITSYNDPNRIHTYSTVGDYQISINGVMETLYFNGTGDKDKIISIDAWGETNLKSLRRAFKGCTNLKKIVDGNSITGDISSVTNMESAFQSCTSLIKFPIINTSNVTNFYISWYGCSGLTSFPLIDTSKGINFNRAWSHCSGLTSFPLIDTSKGTNFDYAWNGCSSLTSFPLIDTSSGTDFSRAWETCIGLTSFPLIDTSKGTNFDYAWNGCSSLTSFPLIDTSKGTNFDYAWSGCSGLTSFPLIDTSSGTDFSRAWDTCSSLTSFPSINTSKGTDFNYAWNACSSLTSFPSINISKGTDFNNAWFGCQNLTSFPKDMFKNCSAINFTQTFESTNLTATSKNNILISLDVAGQLNGKLGITGGNPLVGAGLAAWNNMKNTKGWTAVLFIN